MPQVYKKVCCDCLREFESAGSKSCPYCGSDRWNFVDDMGGVTMPIEKMRNVRGTRAYGKKLKTLVKHFHPALVCVARVMARLEKKK